MFSNFFIKRPIFAIVVLEIIITFLKTKWNPLKKIFESIGTCDINAIPFVLFFRKPVIREPMRRPWPKP